TRGFTSAAANPATASRNAISSSDSTVSGGRTSVVLSAVIVRSRRGGSARRGFGRPSRDRFALRVAAARVPTRDARAGSVPAARRLLAGQLARDRQTGPSENQL